MVITVYSKSLKGVRVPPKGFEVRFGLLQGRFGMNMIV